MRTQFVDPSVMPSETMLPGSGGYLKLINDINMSGGMTKSLKKHLKRYKKRRATKKHQKLKLRKSQSKRKQSKRRQRKSRIRKGRKRFSKSRKRYRKSFKKHLKRTKQSGGEFALHAPLDTTSTPLLGVVGGNDLKGGVIALNQAKIDKYFMA